ncbi:hypothetical protein MCOR17_004950 [Pyricularia oryzae]|nr:hypothetical protein MCOR17_004950 [Pyricularia oryzae]KAI6490843.1 hypothetical protein MCOR13_008404 [Pyricularia oryzae]
MHIETFELGPHLPSYVHSLQSTNARGTCWKSHWENCDSARIASWGISYRSRIYREILLLGCHQHALLDALFTVFPGYSKDKDGCWFREDPNSAADDVVLRLLVTTGSLLACASRHWWVSYQHQRKPVDFAAIICDCDSFSNLRDDKHGAYHEHHYYRYHLEHNHNIHLHHNQHHGRNPDPLRPHNHPSPRRPPCKPQRPGPGLVRLPRRHRAVHHRNVHLPAQHNGGQRRLRAKHCSRRAGKPDGHRGDGHVLRPLGALTTRGTAASLISSTLAAGATFLN